MFDQSEQVRAMGRSWSAHIVLGQAVELPQHRFSRIDKMTVQSSFEVNSRHTENLLRRQQ
jgi:hypothetical protein